METDWGVARLQGSEQGGAAEEAGASLMTCRKRGPAGSLGQMCTAVNGEAPGTATSSE